MDNIQVQELINKGESSQVQFKEQVKDAYKIATEMVAFSNSSGGTIIIGVNDKTGHITGLSYNDIQTTNSLLVNAASENVKSAITIFTETVTVEEKNVLVVQIKNGTDKPYRDNKGIIWIKNGSDKRKVMSNDEMARLMQSSGNLYADEQVILTSKMADVDLSALRLFFQRRYMNNLKELKTDLDILLQLALPELLVTLGLHQPLPQLLQNMGLAKEEHLTLAGLLLFAENPHYYKPMFNIQCVSFWGNELGGTEFKDKENINGHFLSIFKQAEGFWNRHLRKIQKEKDFNSPGYLEIPSFVLSELLVNALVHRDYFIQSSIKLFIFDNRVEIISPGKLPNSLTIEKIKNGISIARNPTMHSMTQFILPYSGLGSGIRRVMEHFDQVELENDTDSDRFKATIYRMPY